MNIFKFQSRILVVLSSIGLIWFLIKHMTLEDFGKYTILILISNILLILGKGSMGEVLQHHFHDTKLKDNLLYTVTKKGLLGSILIFIIFSITSFILSKFRVSFFYEIQLLILILISFTIVMSTINDIFVSWRLCNGEINSAVLLSSFPKNILIISISSILVLGKNKLELIQVVEIYLISTIIQLLFFKKEIIIIYKYLKNRKQNKEEKISRSHGLNNVGMMLSSVFVSTVDSFYIGVYLGYKEVAIYSVAVKILSIITLIPATFNPLTINLIINSKGINYNNVEKVFEKYSYLSLQLSIIIALIIYIFSEQLSIILGVNEDFPLLVFLILAAGKFSECLFTFHANALNIYGYSKEMLYLNIFNMFINLILVIILGGRYGIIGISIGVSISYTLYYIGYYIIFIRYFKKVNNKLIFLLISSYFFIFYLIYSIK